MEILRKNRRGLILVAPANEVNTVDNSYDNDEWLWDVEGASKKKECVFKNDLVEEGEAKNAPEEDTGKPKKKEAVLTNDHVEEEEEAKKDLEEDTSKSKKKELVSTNGHVEEEEVKKDLEEDTSKLKKKEDVITNDHIEVEEEVENDVEDIMNKQDAIKTLDNSGKLEIVGQSIKNSQKEISDEITPPVKEGKNKNLAKSPSLMSLVSLDLRVEEDWLEGSICSSPIMDLQDEEQACSCFPWACTMKDRFRRVRGFFTNLIHRKGK